VHYGYCDHLRLRLSQPREFHFQLFFTRLLFVAAATIVLADTAEGRLEAIEVGDFSGLRMIDAAQVDGYAKPKIMRTWGRSSALRPSIPMAQPVTAPNGAIGVLGPRPGSKLWPLQLM
jgi:hypothetical protein